MRSKLLISLGKSFRSSRKFAPDIPQHGCGKRPIIICAALQLRRANFPVAGIDRWSVDHKVTVPAKQRISKKVQTAMDALVAGDVKTIKDAAEKVGLHRESLSPLSIPHVAAHLRQKVIRHLAIAAAHNVAGRHARRECAFPNSESLGKNSIW
jgi:hypothetical protein